MSLVAKQIVCVWQEVSFFLPNVLFPFAKWLLFSLRPGLLALGTQFVRGRQNCVSQTFYGRFPRVRGRAAQGFNIKKATCLSLPKKLFVFGKSFLSFCQTFCFILPSSPFLFAPRFACVRRLICSQAPKLHFPNSLRMFPKKFVVVSRKISGSSPNNLWISPKELVSVRQVRSFLLFRPRALWPGFVFAIVLRPFCPAPA